MLRFSIIIPTYRRPLHALACLESLGQLNFSRSDFEVILVEDGPGETPLSEKSLAPHYGALQLKVIRQDNAGPAAARNRAAQEAKGQFLVFTDDDCRPELDWLKVFDRAFEQAPDAVLGGHSENALTDNTFSQASQTLLDYIYEYFQKRGSPFFASNNIALSRSNFLRVGGFDPKFQGAGGEDRDFCSRCLEHQLEFIYLPRAVIQHYHELSLKTFCRQHVNYGRGAYVFHAARQGQEHRPVELEPLSFYTDLIRYPHSLPRERRQPFGCSLMVLSQAANAYGYFQAKFKDGGAGSLPQGDGEKQQTQLVAREAGGSGMANLLGIGCRYFAMLGATHLLGTHLFGDYTLTLAITGLMVTISMLGLAPGVLPFLSRARNLGNPQAVRSVVRSAMIPVLAISTLLSLLVGLGAPWAGEVLFQKPQLQRFLVPLSGLILIGAVSTLLGTLLQGFMAVKERAWIDKVLVSGTIATGMGIGWALDLGLLGVLGATLAGAALGLVAAIRLLGKRAPGVLSLSQPAEPLRIGELLAYSWPLMGTSMLSFLLLWTDVLSMGVLSNSQAIGTYGAAARIAVIALIAHESLGPVFTARLSDLHAVKNWMGIEHLYKLTARWAMWPGLALAWALTLWGSDILALFGPEFRSGSMVLGILCLGKAVASSTGMTGRVLGITGRARLNLINMGLLVVGNVALNALWIPEYGGIGAACATSLCVTLVRILQVVQIKVLYGMLPWGRESLIPLVSISGLAALAYPLRAGPAGTWGWTLPLAIFLAACFMLFMLAGGKKRGWAKA